MIETFFEILFQTIIWTFIKGIGASIRWIFLQRKYSFKEILSQNWNGRIGLLVIISTVLLTLLIKKRFNTPSNINNISKNEFKKFSNNKQIKSGDIIFQTSLSRQSKAIQLATNSKYSHCGLIYQEGNSYFVFEAVQPVKHTPLDKWIARGQDGKFVIKRLKNADKILIPETLKKMKQVGDKFNGKNYDLTFEWSDDKIYCSELIWKIYYRAIGIEIGKLQKLKDFDLSNGTVKRKMHERYVDKIPSDEIVISPASIFESELLITIKAN